MTNNVIDFKAFRKKHEPEAPTDESAFDGVPWLTVSFYEGEGGPLRIAGHFDGPEHMREAARRMQHVIALLLNRAYTADPNEDDLLRCAVHLFHSGRLSVDTFNNSGPEGDFCENDGRWMIGALPYVGMEIMRQAGIDPEAWPTA